MTRSPLMHRGRAAVLGIQLGILAPTAAAALIIYGRNGPPTLESMSREADCVVVAAVRFDSIGIVKPDTSRRMPGQPSMLSMLPTPLTPVTLIVERAVVPDSLGTTDTLHSYLRGGRYRDENGKSRGIWIEDEPFSEVRCDGRRCVLFLARVKAPLPEFGERVYRPIDSFNAILLVDSDERVSRVPIKPEKYKTLSLKDCIHKIESARRKR